MSERLLVAAILIVVIGIPAGITWAKGQRAAFFFGFLLLGLVWVVAACRLARPESWWARRFYGPAKLQLAMDRFDSGASPEADSLWAYTWVYAQVSDFWERLSSPGELPFVNARVIWRLVIAFLILVPVIGRFSDYREGAGHDKLVIEVVWRVVWISYNLLQVAIVALLVLAAYRYVRLRKSGYGHVSSSQGADRRPSER